VAAERRETRREPPQLPGIGRACWQWLSFHHWLDAKVNSVAARELPLQAAAVAALSVHSNGGEGKHCAASQPFSSYNAKLPFGTYQVTRASLPE
jgi:hypothetical protein